MYVVQTSWFSIKVLGHSSSLIPAQCLVFYGAVQSSQLFILLINTSAWSTHRLVVYGVEVLGPFKCFLAFRADKAFYMPLLVKSPQRPVCDWLTASSTLWKNRVCVAMITIRLSLPLPVAH